MQRRATANSWRCKPLPEEQAELLLDGTFSSEHFDKLSFGYIPKNAKDKWFLYYADGWLYFHRATTGSCIFQLEILERDDHYTAPRALANRNPAQYRSVSDEYDVQLMAYLIDRYLLGRNPVFPQPNRLNRQHRTQHQAHVIGDTDPANHTIINLNSLLDGSNGIG